MKWHESQQQNLYQRCKPVDQAAENSGYDY